MTNRSTIAEILNDKELLALFERTAQKNGVTGGEILSRFIKDYIVSGGRPWQVSGGMVPAEKTGD